LVYSSENIGTVLGALNPVNPQSTTPSVEAKTIANGNRKRKPSTEVLHEVVVSSPYRMDVDEEAKVLVFRDGEHTGEATLKEIAEGVDDGELSENCQVFDNVDGDWYSFQSFLLELDKRKTVAPLVDPRGEIERAADAPPNRVETKKAPRTSSTWGCAVPPQISTMPAAATGSANNHAAARSHQLQQTSSTVTTAAKSKKHKHEKPPPKIMRLATQAVMQWNMIQEGDRLLLGLSGGKDSLSLLHCLLELKRKLPMKFEIEVCTSKFAWYP